MHQQTWYDGTKRYEPYASFWHDPSKQAAAAKDPEYGNKTIAYYFSHTDSYAVAEEGPGGTKVWWRPSAVEGYDQSTNAANIIHETFHNLGVTDAGLYKALYGKPAPAVYSTEDLSLEIKKRCIDK